MTTSPKAQEVVSVVRNFRARWTPLSSQPHRAIWVRRGFRVLLTASFVANYLPESFSQFLPSVLFENLSALNFGALVISIFTEFPVRGVLGSIADALFVLFFVFVKRGLFFAGSATPPLLAMLARDLPLYWHVATCVLHVIAGLLILPAQMYNGIHGLVPRMMPERAILECKEILIQYCQGAPVDLVTPDGVKLSAWHCLGVGNTPSGPTVLCLGGNGELYETKTEEVIAYQTAGVNVLLVNYRGVAQSSGYATRDGLMLDADTCIQYLLTALNVPANKILIHGRSLGGGVGAEVAAMHPGVCICNERSFSSLSATVICILPLMFGLPPASLVSRGLSTAAALAVAFAGWDMHPARHWFRVSGFKWLEFVPNDVIIAEPARLITTLRRRAATSDITLIEMEAKPRTDAHNRPLTPAEQEEHMRLVRHALGLDQ